MEARIRARLTPREGRRFGLTVGAAFCVLGALSWWRGHDLAPQIFAGIGILLALAGLVAPTRLGPVQAGWMGMARAISKVTTPIFMGLVYFLVFAPVGLLARAIGRNPLQRPGQKGVWIPRDPSRHSDLHRQF